MAETSDPAGASPRSPPPDPDAGSDEPDGNGEVDASKSSVSTNANYLKSYPYLFVRETDQTDYFCTICEASLKEQQLQSHLFDGHSAENLQVKQMRADIRDIFIRT